MSHMYRRMYLLLVCFLLTGCAGAAPGTVSTSALTLTGVLEVHAPSQLQAGNPMQVRIERHDAPDGLVVTLVAQGSYGAQVYYSTFAKGAANVLLSGDDLQASGLLTLIASADSARGEGHVDVLPGAPVDPITPLVGGRSIVADTKHWSMVVAIPFDAYGNPVADGTPVDMRTLHPDQRLETTSVQTINLLAWQRIFSGTRAGRTTISINAEKAYGPESTLQEVPGAPATFGLSASPDRLPADGRHFLTLRTDIIRDAFGNPMLDGTLITFVVETPTGEPRFIPAYTIDGIAEAQLQASTQPGTFTVRATVYDVESKPLQITFTPGPAIGTFPVKAHVNAREGVVAIDAGPLLGPLDQFVPEAVPVRFRVVAPNGHVVELPSEAVKGYAHTELRLAALASGSYTVEVQVGAGRGETSFIVP